VNKQNGSFGGDMNSSSGRWSWILFLLSSIAFSGAVLADCNQPGEPWITLDVTAPLAGNKESLEWVEITHGGCVTTRYASYDIRAGVYQRDVDATKLSATMTVLRQTRVEQFDSAKVNADIRAQDTVNARAAGFLDQHFVVADGDVVRIAIHAQDGTRTAIVFEAPKQMSTAYPAQTELADLVKFIEHIEQVGADPTKRKIAPVTP
jgi:hypothetical protein